MVMMQTAKAMIEESDVFLCSEMRHLHKMERLNKSPMFYGMLMISTYPAVTDAFT